MFWGSSGFPFCLVQNLVQFLFTSLWIDVLDKGCGGIHVQVYVGCLVFEVVKSYLCVSVPVLDDDCGAFVRFVYDDSIMDDKLFQGLSLFVCWVIFGFQWHL